MIPSISVMNLVPGEVANLLPDFSVGHILSGTFEGPEFKCGIKVCWGLVRTHVWIGESFSSLM